MRSLALACLCAAGPAAADAPGVSLTYVCDGGAVVSATYGKQDGTDSVVLTRDGETFTLLAELSGSGVRYGWPSDGSHNVWWTKGNTATLYWRDGAAGTETPVLENCRAD